jgi:hypothetical protein
MKYGAVTAGAFLLLVSWARPAFAAEPRKEPLADQVRKSIERGINYLRQQQRPGGHWEVDATCAAVPGGWTCLTLLALLTAGVPPDDPMVQKGLAWVRQQEPDKTYVRGLQTAVFVKAGQPEDKERIQHNADWLIDARVFDNDPFFEHQRQVGALFAFSSEGPLHHLPVLPLDRDNTNHPFVGWTYAKSSGRLADNSNTQYALLGLYAAHSAGAKIDRKVWRLAREMYVRKQQPDGGWFYDTRFGTGTTLTMTTAGLSGLVICDRVLNAGREVIRSDGTGAGCGLYGEDRRAAGAFSWVGKRFDIINQHSVYYNLHGLARVGLLTGQRFLSDDSGQATHDWYREGCEYLVSRQNLKDGSWKGMGREPWPVVCTSYSLLFLCQGRTPVLICKLAHGPDQDWDNDRNDAGHLVEFAGKELFKRQPLTWQVFDARKARVNDQNDLLNLTSNLLESPVVYFNGHRAPKFTAREKELLKQFVAGGGLILAEACCGKADFDEGFRKLAKDLWPKSQLQALPKEHPVWRAHFMVKPGDPFALEGVEIGGRTAVIYSPKDLSCLWEANNVKDGRGQAAFRLGTNIIAYATAKKPPQPRLSRAD